MKTLMASKTKKTIFKNEYGKALRTDNRISSCCGATLHGIDDYQLAYYAKAKDAAGLGILLSDQPPTKALVDHEKLTSVATRNGMLYFTTRHKG